jgi:hypothetical protein
MDGVKFQGNYYDYNQIKHVMRMSDFIRVLFANPFKLNFIRAKRVSLTTASAAKARSQIFTSKL